MNKLTIIDQETRDELAEFGMVPARRVVLCRDCRYRIMRIPPPAECMVNGEGYCLKHNPHGECERFEPRETPPWKAPAIYTGLGITIGFLLGLVLL